MRSCHTIELRLADTMLAQFSICHFLAYICPCSATSISFALADPQAATAASPATVVCAGSSYTVVINFGGQLRNALITASVGVLQPSGQSSGLGSMVAQAVTGISQNLGLLNMYTDTW